MMAVVGTSMAEGAGATMPIALAVGAGGRLGSSSAGGGVGAGTSAAGGSVAIG